MYAPGISFYSSIVSIDSHIDFFKNFEKRVKQKTKKRNTVHKYYPIKPFKTKNHLS